MYIERSKHTFQFAIHMKKYMFIYKQVYWWIIYCIMCIGLQVCVTYCIYIYIYLYCKQKKVNMKYISIIIFYILQLKQVQIATKLN